MPEPHRSALAVMAAPLIEDPVAPLPSVAQLRRRNTRRHRRTLARTAAGGAALGLVVALVVVLAVPGGPPSPSPAPASDLASYVVTATQVPDSVLEQVGLPSSVTPPTAVAGQPPLLTAGGLPAVVYVGGEYCPYCALERWSLVVALSRFGTFAHLGQAISSTSNDVDPGLQSWSFHGSSYSSSYVTFDPAEITSATPTPADNGYTPLDSLSPLQKTAFDVYDAPPYTKDGGNNAIPFVDVGNRYLTIGSSASPSVLKGLSLDQIAADLSNPSSPVAQAVDGTANYLIGALCAVTGRTKPPVCATSLAAQTQARLGAG
jgi:uncharacterized protein DUF929